MGHVSRICKVAAFHHAALKSQYRLGTLDASNFIGHFVPAAGDGDDDDDIDDDGGGGFDVDVTRDVYDPDDRHVGTKLGGCQTPASKLRRLGHTTFALLAGTPSLTLPKKTAWALCLCTKSVRPNGFIMNSAR